VQALKSQFFNVGRTIEELADGNGADHTGERDDSNSIAEQDG
jgi:hypothetical protein